MTHRDLNFLQSQCAYLQKKNFFQFLPLMKIDLCIFYGFNKKNVSDALNKQHLLLLFNAHENIRAYSNKIVIHGSEKDKESR